VKLSLNKFLTRPEQLLLVGVACAMVIGSGIIWLDRGREGLFIEEPTPSSPELPGEGPSAAVPAPSVEGTVQREETQEKALPKQIRIDVTGAVERPGVYTLRSGDIVEDAIRAARGVTEGAELAAINRAAPLVDGSQLLIPTRNPFGRLEPADAEYRLYGAKAELSAKTQVSIPGGALAQVDINRAKEKELEDLPGIGPVKARAIISYRQQQPFRSVEDLLEVKGIGPKTLEGLRDRVSVGS